MRKYLIALLMVLMTLGATAQQFPSQWEVKPEHKLELNYNLLGRHTSQGLFYGAAGYGTGMWLSGNRTEWGIVGAVLATNLPILLENKFNEPETVIGRNLGMITVAASTTIYVELTRKGKLTFELPYFLRKR